MRKQRVHASLRRRRVEDELRLSILLLHGVVMTHHDRAIRIALSSHPQTEQAEVDSERHNGRAQHEDNRAQKDSPEPLPEFGSCQRHGA